MDRSVILGALAIEASGLEIIWELTEVPTQAALPALKGIRFSGAATPPLAHHLGAMSLRRPLTRPRAGTTRTTQIETR